MKMTDSFRYFGLNYMRKYIEIWEKYEKKINPPNGKRLFLNSNQQKRCSNLVNRFKYYINVSSDDFKWNQYLKTREGIMYLLICGYLEESKARSLFRVIRLDENHYSKNNLGKMGSNLPYYYLKKTSGYILCMAKNPKDDRYKCEILHMSNKNFTMSSPDNRLGLVLSYVNYYIAYKHTIYNILPKRIFKIETDVFPKDIDIIINEYLSPPCISCFNNLRICMYILITQSVEIDIGMYEKEFWSTLLSDHICLHLIDIIVEDKKIILKRIFPILNELPKIIQEL